jgi:hypothetical protein
MGAKTGEALKVAQTPAKATGTRRNVERRELPRKPRGWVIVSHLTNPFGAFRPGRSKLDHKF